MVSEFYTTKYKKEGGDLSLIGNYVANRLEEKEWAGLYVEAVARTITVYKDNTKKVAYSTAMIEDDGGIIWKEQTADVNYIKAHITPAEKKVAPLSTTKSIVLKDDNDVKIQIPSGFGIANESSSDADKGIIIEDENENQYVFVYVPRTRTVYPKAGTKITNFDELEYEKIEKDLQKYVATYREGTEFKDEFYSQEITGLTKEQYDEKKQAMLKSIYENEGFYVGRYEAGYNLFRVNENQAISSIKPLSQPNKYPLNFVNCSGAQIIANEADSGTYTSSLMFGIQWDLMLKFIDTTETKKDEILKDSSNWGNYANVSFDIKNPQTKYSITNGTEYSGLIGSSSYTKPENAILITTGATYRNYMKKIYDIAGNVSEWTLEYSNDAINPCVLRGGDYSQDGSINSSAFRQNSSIQQSNSATGFRVTLW